MIGYGGSLPKISRNVLSTKVYSALKEMIANHRFQPGARLNVEKISKELEVSRTPVWEAVRRLQQEGLLEDIPYRGVFMVEMTLEKAFDLYQVREALEGLAARLAALSPNEKVLEKMTQTLQIQMKAIENGDLLGYSRSDFEFHSLIHRMSHNAILQEMLESLKAKMQPISLEVKPILPRLYEDHLEMIEAIRSKDAEKSERILRRHNRGIQNQIQKEIDNYGKR
jgi:DNA-binding GntR family transcriptional regulator